MSASFDWASDMVEVGYLEGAPLGKQPASVIKRHFSRLLFPDFNLRRRQLMA